MAVSSVKLSSALVLKIKTGVDTKGNDLFKNISIKKVKASALEQDVYDVAQGIGGLLNTPISGCYRQDVSEMVSQ